MNTLPKHYALLLGLDEAWQVKNVELSLEEQQKPEVLRHRLRQIS